jgi:hypothetical protein
MTCCGHTFHHSCFKTAFETCSTTCPMCRQEVPEVNICENNVFRTVPNTYSKPPTVFDTSLDVNFQFTPDFDIFDQFLVSQEWADPTEAYASFMNEDANEMMDVEEDDSEYVEDANEMMDVEEDSEYIEDANEMMEEEEDDYTELYDLAGRVLAIFDDEPVNQMMNQPVILV